VAAHLAMGVPLEALGPRTRTMKKLAPARPRKIKNGLVGRIVSVDRFGNLITNLEPADWRSVRRARLVAGDFSSSKLHSSYAAAPPGELLLVFGGYGLLEIAVRNGSAAETLGLGVNGRIHIVSAGRVG
jgi:S-adenosylmethionine hydrolase